MNMLVTRYRWFTGYHREELNTSLIGVKNKIDERNRNSTIKTHEYNFYSCTSEKDLEDEYNALKGLLDNEKIKELDVNYEKRLAEIKEKNEAIEKENKTRKKSMIFVLTILGIFVVGAIIFVIIQSISKKQAIYDKAMTLDATGVSEAVELLQEIPGYKDADEKIEIIKNNAYTKALSYIEEDNYNEAFEIFSALGNYEDSSEYKRFCNLIIELDNALTEGGKINVTGLLNFGIKENLSIKDESFYYDRYKFLNEYKDILKNSPWKYEEDYVLAPDEPGEAAFHSVDEWIVNVEDNKVHVVKDRSGYTEDNPDFVSSFPGYDFTFDSIIYQNGVFSSSVDTGDVRDVELHKNKVVIQMEDPERYIYEDVKLKSIVLH